MFYTISQTIFRLLPLKFCNKLIRWLAQFNGLHILCKINGVKMRIDISEYIQREMFLGEYEPTQTKWVKECLSPNDIFVDVGANFGYYTSLASQIVQKSGRVFAFEPSPIAAQSIKKIITINKIKNIELFQSAVGDKNGSLEIFMPSDNKIHSPSAFFSDPSYKPLEVPLLALDSFEPFKYLGVQGIKLIKIDVEGYEPNVINGMHSLMEQGLVQNIICEFNSGWLRHNSTKPSELFDNIIKSGFVVHKKTTLSTNIESDGKTTYELQDIWFSKNRNI